MAQVINSGEMILPNSKEIHSHGVCLLTTPRRLRKENVGYRTGLVVAKSQSIIRLLLLATFTLVSIGFSQGLPGFQLIQEVDGSGMNSL